MKMNMRSVIFAVVAAIVVASSAYGETPPALQPVSFSADTASTSGSTAAPTTTPIVVTPASVNAALPTSTPEVDYSNLAAPTPLDIPISPVASAVVSSSPLPVTPVITQAVAPAAVATPPIETDPTPVGIQLAPVTTAPTAPVVTVDGDVCKFRFCVASPTTFTVGKSIDTSFTGRICHKNGTLIGTVDQSGEAYLMDGTPISKWSPTGLKQSFAPSFFKAFSLKPKHVYSGIGHETPQQNQGDFLNGKTFILPLKVYQVLNEEGNVIAEIASNDKTDCIKFSTSTGTPPVPTQVAPTPAAPAPVPSPSSFPSLSPAPSVVPTTDAPIPTAPVPAVTVPPTAPGCKFKFCVGTSEFTVGGSADTPFTGRICKKDGTPIGTVDESGEATLRDGTPISKYAPSGLVQPFSNAFFRTSPIKATKYVYSGVAHQLPQTNQAEFLNGKTWILPLKAYQVLNSKGDVIDEVVGKPGDCVVFTTKV